MADVVREALADDLREAATAFVLHDVDGRATWEEWRTLASLNLMAFSLGVVDAATFHEYERLLGLE